MFPVPLPGYRGRQSVVCGLVHQSNAHVPYIGARWAGDRQISEPFEKGTGILAVQVAARIKARGCGLRQGGSIHNGAGRVGGTVRAAAQDNDFGEAGDPRGSGQGRFPALPPLPWLVTVTVASPPERMQDGGGIGL